MKKISIIVPVFNSSKYIGKCLKSLINQTITNIEIILINDGSTDQSREIIKTFNDNRIKYIEQENKGIGYSRNLGIEKSTGDYICFIDSDDYVEENFCENMYNQIIENDYDLVVGNFIKITPKKSIKIVIPRFDGINIKEDPTIINKINFGPCNKMYKKELIIKENIRFAEDIKYEDFTFIANIILKAKKIGQNNDFLSYYIIHDNSETTTMNERVFDIIIAIDSVKKTFMHTHQIAKCFNTLIVLMLTDYTIQQRNQNDKIIRNKFIDEVFSYLDINYPLWREDSFFKQINYFKKVIKTNKVLTKFYCNMYYVFKSR